MIYLAGILILLGSFILLLTFFQESKPSYQTKGKSVKNKSQNSSQHKTKGFTILTVDSRKNAETDSKIRKERELEPQEEEPPMTDQTPVLERIFADDVKYAELVQEDEKLEQETSPVIHIRGILFLDYARKIPENLKKNYHEKWKEENFLHFKRIGSVELEEDSGVVHFFITNQTIHKLFLEEVEQILFYRNAFTLIPENPTLPISVFFTDEIDKFKEHVSKKYSSIEHYIKK